jgi:hypothetical protein
MPCKYTEISATSCRELYPNKQSLWCRGCDRDFSKELITNKLTEVARDIGTVSSVIQRVPWNNLDDEKRQQVQRLDKWSTELHGLSKRITDLL